MLLTSIQLFFLLSLCIPLQGMDIYQKNRVHHMLTNKHQLTNWDQATNILPKIQPLSVKLHSPTIKANHTKYLYNNKENETVIHNFKQAFECIPDDLTILQQNSKTAYQSMRNSVQKLALQGNEEAQIAITTNILNKFFTIKADQNKNITYVVDNNLPKPLGTAYAFELLHFIKSLHDKKISLIALDPLKSQFIKARETTNPAASYIIQSCLCLQAITEQQYKLRLEILLDKKCTEDPSIEFICQFLINDGNKELSPEDAAKKFIQSLMKQKASTKIFTTIARLPVYPNIIHALEKANLKDNDPLLPDFDYCSARLYDEDQKHEQAHALYLKNKPSYLKQKSANDHAFKACLLSTNIFTPKDISYLSSLSGNILNQLAKLEKTNPQLSYHTGILIEYLLQNNRITNQSEKITAALNGLENLAYAQKNSTWNKQELNNISDITVKLYMILSNIYEDQKDSTAALKHITNALEHKLITHPEARESEIITILNEAQKENLEFYNKHACLITTLLKYIYNEPYALSQKHYNVAPQFSTSHVCQQLLSHCEQSLKKNKIKDDKIIYLLSLIHHHSNNNNLARHYIDMLSPQTMSLDMLETKIKIYTSLKKHLLHQDLESLFKMFLNDKRKFFNKGEMIQNIIGYNLSNFFIETNAQTIARNFIVALVAEHQTITKKIVHFVYTTTKKFTDTKDPHLNQWLKTLDSCQFYNKLKDPIEYDADTNMAIGLLLTKKNPKPYEKIFSYFNQANSQSTSWLMDNPKKLSYAMLYREWAASMAHDEKTFFDLIDKAIMYDSSGMAKHEKGIFILQNSNDQNLINLALELFEDNIKKNTQAKELSQLEIAYAYLNKINDAQRLPILSKLIPRNINKAIKYLESLDNNEEALQLLAHLFSGLCSSMKEEEYAAYIDYDKALHYVNILLTLKKNNINYLMLRVYIYKKQNKLEEALSDIDYLLNTTNDTDIIKENLLSTKISLLLDKELNKNTSKQIIQLDQQLRTYYKTVMLIDEYSTAKNYTNLLIQNDDMSPHAIEWCCLVARSNIHSGKKKLTSNQEQKKLGFYLLTAAQRYNLDAQLIALPYLVHYKDSPELLINTSLIYAYEALCNPLHNEKKQDTSILLDFLQESSNDGDTRAYYILCDYHKNNPEKFEQTILSFSQAQTQFHFLYEDNDMINKIYTNTRDIFLTYVSRYINSTSATSKNNKTKITKQPLLDALATFTLGAMCLCSSKQDLLDRGAFYLNLVKDLPNTFKLTHFQKIINLLLAETYYRNVSEIGEDKKIINVNLLRRCINLGLVKAAHKLAELWIQEQKQNSTEKLITENDFIPLLNQDIMHNNSINSRSFQLLEECLKLSDVINKKESASSYSLSEIHKHKPNDKEYVDCIEKRLRLTTELACKKNMTKYPNYKEQSRKCIEGMNLQQIDKLTEAVRLLQEAIKKEQHPNAGIFLAYLHITKELKDYTKSEQALPWAFKYGLVAKSHNNSHKQFHNPAFINFLFFYIEELLQPGQDTSMKSNLLSLVKEYLSVNNVNLADFCQLFYDITKIDLSLIPAWKTKKEKTLEQKKI